MTPAKAQLSDYFYLLGLAKVAVQQVGQVHCSVDAQVHRAEEVVAVGFGHTFCVDVGLSFRSVVVGAHRAQHVVCVETCMATVDVVVFLCMGAKPSGGLNIHAYHRGEVLAYANTECGVQREYFVSCQIRVHA